MILKELEAAFGFTHEKGNKLYDCIESHPDYTPDEIADMYMQIITPV